MRRAEFPIAILAVLVIVGCKSEEQKRQDEAEQRVEAAKLDDTRKAVAQLAAQAEMYVVQKGGKCPDDLASLKRAGITTSTPHDTWGTEFKIVCADGKVTGVASAGPDAQRDTADDIRSW